MPRLDEFVFAPDQEAERVYLLGLGLPGVAAEELEEQMEGLAGLARTAGAEVVGSVEIDLRGSNRGMTKNTLQSRQIPRMVSRPLHGKIVPARMRADSRSITRDSL